MSAFYIGLMSGTSLDGVDAALIDFDCEAWQVLGSLTLPFDATLQSQLRALASSATWPVRDFQNAELALTEAYANAVRSLLKKTDSEPAAIQALGCHGQTLRHWPEQGFSYQLLNPALLAEHTGIDVACDFRRRDLAAGGQGAPLVTAFQESLAGKQHPNATFLNLGGIANITCLESGSARLAFDTGPANTLIDAYCREHLNRPYDEGGRLARQGCVDESFLAEALKQPFFELAPPKSTGPELFNLSWLAQMGLSSCEQRADSLATLSALSARSAARAIKRYSYSSDLFVFGGGLYNQAIMTELQEQLEGYRISSTSALGIDPDVMEAAAFGWLAWRLKTRAPGNCPTTTGAAGSRILGGYYPS